MKKSNRRVERKPTKKANVEGIGLEKLLGERITLLCLNYFYTGKLIETCAECVLLEDPSIIYETGVWDKGEWQDAQALTKQGGQLYVMRATIESFGMLK